MNRSLLLLLLSYGAASGSTPIIDDPVVARAGGDGASLLIELQNRAVHGKTFVVGVGGVGVSRAVPGYADMRIFAQCAGAHAPLLVATDGHTQLALTPPPMMFPDGAPALWITSARSGRAALERLIKGTGEAERLAMTTPGQMPPTFASLRLAPLLLMDVAEFGALSARRRDAVVNAAAAGVVLVLAAGPTGGEEAVKSAFGITIGPSRKPGPALQRAFGRVAGQRLLGGEGGRIMAEADGAPVAVERPYGLGIVRVVAVPFEHLEPGPVTAMIFSTEGRGLNHALDWLTVATPLGDTSQTPFSSTIWVWLVGLLLLGGLARWWPRLALALAPPVVLVGAILPPGPAPLTVDGVRALVVRTPTGTVQIGTMDLQIGVGGPHGLPSADGFQLALEEASPEGACLVGDAAGSQLLLSGEPTDRRRITFVAIGPAGVEANDPGARLPDWPAGYLAGAQLAKAAGESPVAASGPIELWLATPTPIAERPPLTLDTGPGPL